MNQKGFTLIELLVVIAIIGLMAGISVVALNSARQKSRDARRITDIKQLQTALEMFYDDVGQYPTSSAFSFGGALTNSGTTYINPAPQNPSPRDDGGCADAEYTYQQDSSSSYSLTYCLGADTGGIAAGSHTSTPAGMTDD
jgi:type II secretion system protein G